MRFVILIIAVIFLLWLIATPHAKSEEMSLCEAQHSFDTCWSLGVR